METQSARNAGTYVFVAHGVRIYKNTSISNGNVLCYYIVKIAIQRGKMHMKKTITTLLLLTMLLSQAACGGTKDTDTETTGTDTTTDTTTQGDRETETEQADPLAGLEAVEMECYTFRQLIRNNDDFVADMIAEEQPERWSTIRYSVGTPRLRNGTISMSSMNVRSPWQRNSSDSWVRTARSSIWTAHMPAISRSCPSRKTRISRPGTKRSSPPQPLHAIRPLPPIANVPANKKFQRISCRKMPESSFLLR